MLLHAKFSIWCPVILGFLSSPCAAHYAGISLENDHYFGIHEKRGQQVQDACQGAPTATIESGIVIGTTTSLPSAIAAVNKFLGVPFAQSPPERFSPPRPASKYNVPINATGWKPACIQQFRYPQKSQYFTKNVFNNPAPEESEDCLYLNIYAPSTPAGPNGRAVLFWIFGGSLQFGTAGQPNYDGAAFAAYEDVIVVTANYRTNVFGFPNSPELPLLDRNLAFLDQRFALNWVQRNIYAFGGDAEKVTVFGESAGAYSVDALLTSYPKGSSPPFRAAILQSGQMSYRPTKDNSSLPAWYNLTTTLGCPGNFSSNLTCVRAAEATDIQDIINRNTLLFSPVVDNVTFVSKPALRRVQGNIANIPVLGGTNAQEGRIFVVNQTNLTTYLNNALRYVNPDLIPHVLENYPIGSDGLNNDYDAISQIYTEWIFQCVQALWANATASIGIPTWRYYFNSSFENTQVYPDLGVYHASEIPLVFRTYSHENTTTQQYALAQFLQSSWARFAKNPLAGPGWNRVGTGAEGSTLSGAYDDVVGGLYGGANETLLQGSWDLGVVGDVGISKGSGVTILPQEHIDKRCSLWRPLYAALAGEDAMPQGK